MAKPPRFLCDEMLGSLCRYLRAAGYDAAFARSGASDAELLRQCHAEKRYFLTQDTLITEHKASNGIALILPHAHLDKLAKLVGEHYRIDWTKHAFSRCLVDNTPLVDADETSTAKAPLDARKPGRPLRHCPLCGRVYWRGSHYKRMRARLTEWQETIGDKVKTIQPD
jgi:uncharacterized protein